MRGRQTSTGALLWHEGSLRSHSPDTRICLGLSCSHCHSRAATYQYVRRPRNVPAPPGPSAGGGGRSVSGHAARAWRCVSEFILYVI
ncbi:hypothetical protein STXM2123_2494 [Streptomyces sp. F-3]|nr:hypothetical protein STXM2123_2494 [Streptomyces sp. F-3]